MNQNELLTHQMGVFGQVYHNRVQNLGGTEVEAVAVPMASNSQGTRAMWMEINVPLSVNSGNGVIWNFDIRPADNNNGIGSILPPNTFAWYPVTPTASTLFVLTDGASTRVDVSWYRQAIT
mgnify:FL=1